MSDGMGRELAYLSSHATNRYFIPNWGIYMAVTYCILVLGYTCVNLPYGTPVSYTHLTLPTNREV